MPMMYIAWKEEGWMHPFSKLRKKICFCGASNANNKVMK